MSDLRSESEDVGLAAEYALGVLDAGERRLAQRRVAEDAGFAAEVRAWEDRLHPLAASVAASEPTAEVWRRVAASTAGAKDQRRIVNDTRPSLWRSLGFWRGATAGMGALAAAAIAFAILPRVEPAPTPEAPITQPAMMVARLAPEGGAPLFVVAYDPMRKMTLATPVDGAAPSGHSYQLWLIPVDGDTPVSLGVLRADGSSPIAVSDAVADMARERATMAISVEPTGGSTTGAPTGPVVATGALGRV